MAAQIGAGWTAKAPLREGEQVVDSWRANRTQGRRSVGGKLWLTTERLVFTPNVLDDATGGRPWEADLAGVMEIGKVPPTLRGGPFSGGLRTRMSIGLAGERSELFGVPKVDRVIERIREAVGTSTAGR